jgi:hypothetical protein
MISISDNKIIKIKDSNVITIFSGEKIKHSDNNVFVNLPNLILDEKPDKGTIKKKEIICSMAPESTLIKIIKK